ncbi:MAG: RNA-binding transcriptional accessory protein [Lachnospiraceae bacterium]|nr:RNA-binding transcriptional accessory protein [Lachnospiraceae bacterium]
MDIAAKIADELEIKKWQAEAAITLIDEGNTIPFIARYRKEKTGELHDDVLRTLGERLTYLRNLEEMKEKVLSSIEEQGKLTPELKKAIEAAQTQVAIDDLYRPYKKKRRTRAMIAKEKGLEPLANIITLQMTDKSLAELAMEYVSEEKEVPTVMDALNGAKDIIAEGISDDADYRTHIRELTIKKGNIESVAKDKEAKSVYENYYEFSEPVSKIAGFRVLALNRGEKEKFLQVKINAPEEDILNYLEKKVIVKDNPNTNEVLREAVSDSYSRLIAPSIEREVRNMLTENAEDKAIDVFKKNLSGLLMQPPIAGLTVLGWDPAFRTGCKLSVVDPTGKVLDTAVIFPTAPTNEQKIKAAKTKFLSLIKKHNIDLVSLGNGTASRESEQLICEWIKEADHKVSYLITNEAGASVYSASALATEEFPEFDVGQRSATSMARRVQDPLAELVKIDPKSLGVGQYQHDMNQKKLNEALSGIVESCVNNVGVDLNTASFSLLEYVSGITKTTAKNIVSYREENGTFKNRKELLKVPKMGPKAYEQCAGFLRIRDGENALDATGIHPESYEAAEVILKDLGITEKEIGSPITMMPDFKNKLKKEGSKDNAEKLGVGEITLKDILKEIVKPGRDPREELPKPVLRSDVLSMEDLKSGMILKGTVRNVVDFGAFVDIGVHEDGLVHVSKLTNKKFVKDPTEVVSVGDVVEVKVLDVDKERGRIALTMII